MCEDLDIQAEKYMRSVMNNDGDVFTRSDLYEYIIEAYKQGYRDCAGVIPDIFGDTILSMNKVVLDATQDFRNRLNHKGQMNEFNLGDRVRLKCGRFKGWYGTICEQQRMMCCNDVEVYYSVKVERELPDEAKRVTVIRELQDILEGILASDIELVPTIDELREWKEYFSRNVVIKNSNDPKFEYEVNELPESIRIVIDKALQAEIDKLEKE